jgi:uncharacterized protein YndB with AHSA1/START domain
MADRPGSSNPPAGKTQIERFYNASPAQVSELSTTSQGSETWWAPDGPGGSSSTT